MSNNAFLTERHLEVTPAPSPSGGPVIGADRDTMTVGGVASATSVLLVLLLLGGVAGWSTVEVNPFGGVRFPSWVLGAILAGVVLLVVSFVKPAWARVIAPVYAIVEGLVVGAISHAYEIEFAGIVLQAALLTVAVFAVMLFLYGTRIVKVTDRLRRGVIAATMGIMLVYLAQIVMRVLGADLEVPFLHDSGPLGIAISLLIVGVAAFNYLVDFDFVERAAESGAPKHLEWTAALGLLVTTVWLYLELLRLLAKIRD
jgi:uncharacterized YccA/Bax inhibitor family protein